MSNGDYILGTRDDEVARLGVQHSVWRSEMLEGFRLAGFGAGQTILDIGAGPGFASADLAELVGAGGRVIALERSPHFAATLRARGLANVDVREQDVNKADFGTGIADGAWTRWVLAFVADPARTVRHISKALKPGAMAVFHEYADYQSWRTMPPSPDHEQFRSLIVKSWRESGGEPDIALQLPNLLDAAGLDLVAVRPMIRIVGRDDAAWQWPASFIATGSARLHELGYATSEQAARFATFLDRLPPDTRMITPLVAEIIAIKR
jgi:SAM-dependent methyltransferase